jgi:hypothetical protein
LINYLKNLRKKRLIFNSVSFVVLPPIDVSNINVDQIDTLTNSTRELMLKTLKEITPSHPTHSSKTSINGYTNEKTKEH